MGEDHKSITPVDNIVKVISIKVKIVIEKNLKDKYGEEYVSKVPTSQDFLTKYEKELEGKIKDFPLDLIVPSNVTHSF